jgi:hypothetical protein
MAAEAHAAARFKHGKQHGQPIGVPADDRPARRREDGRGDQRLDFDQQRARSFHTGEHGSAGRDIAALAQEEFDALLTGMRPLPRISNAPISPAGPKRFLTERSSR